MQRESKDIVYLQDCDNAAGKYGDGEFEIYSKEDSLLKIEGI